MSSVDASSLPMATHRLAKEVLAAHRDRRQIAPLTARSPRLSLDQAYQITAAVRQAREARGERVIGRKIGFTNQTIWDEYDVHAPIWGYVYDTTLRRLNDTGGPFDLSSVVEPRIEPEIVFRLSAPPDPAMDERELLDCIEWIAHGFEIVQSLFPGWRFQAADTVAAFGLHGALLLGPQHAIVTEDRDGWFRSLADFEITLMQDGREADVGRSSHVLGGGPLTALRHLVGVLAVDLDSPPLAAGEIVTTGTLTKALPIAPRQVWSTRFSGLNLDGIRTAFT